MNDRERDTAAGSQRAFQALRHQRRRLEAADAPAAGSAACGRRCQPAHRAGRDPRPGRRVRFGQDDPRALPAAADRAERRPGAVQGAEHPGSARRAHAGSAPQDAAHLPGSLLVAQPAHDRAPDAGGGADGAPSLCARRRWTGGSPSCCTWWGCPPTPCSATRATSAAASASASASPAPWPCSRSLSSPTSRCRPWTCRSRRRCSTCSRTSRRSWG